MQINDKHVEILKIEHKGYELKYLCFIGRYTMNGLRDSSDVLRQCRIRIEDLHEIDEMIGALQEMRRQCESSTRWERKAN